MSTRPSDVSRSAPEPIAPNINTLWARVLVDELARAGLEHVVISPGSRSAPLVFQFSAHSDIDDHSVVDERSAAFLALGLARASGKPVALLCTTGTAAANYFPAICEAGRDRVPLLVLTAARPIEDQDCGVQQVMDQNRLFGTQVRAFHALPEPALNSEKLAAFRARIARSWALANGPNPGPVHLDIPFRKPLEPVELTPAHPDGIPTNLADGLAAVIEGRPNGAPWLRISRAASEPALDAVASLRQRIATSRRPLLLAGGQPLDPSTKQALLGFARNAALPVLAEPISGLRHEHGRDPQIIAAGELICAAHDDLHPDLVLLCGSAPLNWGVQRLLHSASAAERIVISETDQLADPEHHATRQIIGAPGPLFDALAATALPGNDARRPWLERWQRAERRVLESLDPLLDRVERLSAPVLWRLIGKLLPHHSALVCSSSMVVRDFDAYMVGCTNSLQVFFNRGLNGIDGAVSTALGVALSRRTQGQRSPTVLVIGDVALRHDLGALPLAAELGLNLTVVVIDNDGGEIFDYLPSANFPDVHEKHFLTTRATRPGGPTPAGLIPRGIELIQPASPTEFVRSLRESLQRPGLKLIRAATERAFDHRLRERIRDAVAEALGELSRHRPTRA